MSITNPQDKMLAIYLQNMQKTVEALCKIINTLVMDDQIVYDAYEIVKDVLGQIKYYEKFNNKQKTVSKSIMETISLIQSNSQHHPGSQILINQRKQVLPPVKYTLPVTINPKSLATIAQKQSQQNLLQNYLRKQSHRKTLPKNPRPPNHHYTKTINDHTNYLNTSRQFDIIRQETRRSLDNSGIHSDKKPLYKELEKFKGNEQMLPAVKNYLDKHNHKRYVTSRNPNYTITKFL